MASVFGLMAMVWALPALAEQNRSEPWQWWMQTPKSPVAERVVAFHDVLIWVEVGVTVFVLAILGYIIVRFNAKSNPIPSTTTHNTLLEVVWTVIPIIILVAISVPSMKLLYFSDRTDDPYMTVKAIGNQWYWTYVYPDHDDLEFDSIMIPDEELTADQPRLLSVDYPLVLPVGKNIRILLGTNDVLHNFAVPSLGLRKDTTPGRANEMWVRINEEGSYYGMCSELCGVNHGFMPVQIEAVSEAEFEKWLLEAQEEWAVAPAPASTPATTMLAQNVQ